MCCLEDWNFNHWWNWGNARSRQFQCSAFRHQRWIHVQGSYVRQANVGTMHLNSKFCTNIAGPKLQWPRGADFPTLSRKYGVEINLQEWTKIGFQAPPARVSHSVGSEGPHHAELLQRRLVLPLLRKLLLLRTFAFHELLPAFGRALDVAVQVAELFHVAQGLGK